MNKIMNISILKISSIAIAVLSLLSCNSQSQNQDQKESKNKGHFIKLKNFSYVDQQGTGTEAFSMLLPVDWQFEGGIQYSLDNPAMPGVLACRAFSQDRKQVFEIFPNRSFFWTTSQEMIAFFPPGSKYLGNTVRSPLNALEAIKEVILPEERSSFQDLVIISEEDLPGLPEAVGATAGINSGTQKSGAKIRVGYTEGGIPMEEDIFAVVETVQYSQPSMYGMVNNWFWTMDYQFSFKAEKGKLDNHSPMFQTLITSFRLNPQWYAKYMNFIDFLVQQQIQRTNSIGELSRYISRQNDEMTASMRESYEARSRVYDKIYQNWSDATLGIDRYQNSSGAEVRLPSGYNHAWSNQNGEYIISDNPNFNPNQGSNISWEELKRK
jgi:hypothetical protein